MPPWVAIRTGEQPAGGANGEPIGMAEVVGPATHQARDGPAAHGALNRQTHADGGSDNADHGRLQNAEIEGAQNIQQRRAADIWLQALLPANGSSIVPYGGSVTHASKLSAAISASTARQSPWRTRIKTRRPTQHQPAHETDDA
jgi:hypothetical protein